MISNEELLRFSKQGFIAGPGEKEDALLRRINACLDQTALPIEAGRSSEGKALLKSASESVEKLADIAPTWVPVVLSSHRLLPWQGGLAFIYQINSDSPRQTFLQIRPGCVFCSTPEEITKHELIHVARMQFDEPRFEEMLAYMTSKKPIPYYLGPLVRSPLWVNLFVFSLMLILFLDFIALLTWPDVYIALLPLKLIPLGMIAYAAAELIRDRNVLNKALRHLERATGSSKNAHGVIFRLKDEEIALFAKLSPESIIKHAEALKESEARWKQIYPYFNT